MYSEQVWPRGGISCSALPKVYGLGRRAVADKQGPADIVATCGSSKWFIQGKAKAGIPRLRGYEVKRLNELAENSNSLPVISKVQHFRGGFSIGNYSILFYLLDSWQELDPMKFPGRGDCIASKSSACSQ